MRKKIDNKNMFLAVLFILLIASTVTFAEVEQSVYDRINCAICRIASLIFYTAGAISALVIVIAGLRWATSSDDPGVRNAAKITIVSVFVGLVIIMIAVYIVMIVIDGLLPGEIDPTDWMISNPPCQQTCANAGVGGGGATT